MPIKRLFAAGSVLPHDMARLRSHDGVVAPETWSLEAIEAFKEALCADVPAKLNAIEENTMPSWLWRHRARGESVHAETQVMDVFDRIAGEATYRGWKAGLWKNETEASTFYDETRALLLTRRLILAPKAMARMGVTWAYGLALAPQKTPMPLDPAVASSLLLQNETIDSILGGCAPTARGKWTRFLEGSQRREKVSVAFIDTITEWNAPPAADAPRAMLNLMAFRQEDGTLDVVGLEQAAKLAVLLLDLHYETIAAPNASRPLALGFGNLAGLLMSLGIAYNSAVGRSTASALAALITATACATSASLAAKLGPCTPFLPARESVLRNMENQIRAAFGEKNDYDRLSVLPQTLELDSGLDLVLLSTVRHIYDKAIDLVRVHGLRHMQLTALFHDPDFAALADAYAQGIEAEAALCCDYAIDNELFKCRVNPAVPLALTKAGYDRADCKAVCDHLVGYRTLIAAPGISHTLLREKGFTDEALERLEAYLPHVAHINTAFTPSVLGYFFCRDQLGVAETELKDPGFDLLRHLGFTSKDIALANGFCCGHPSVKGVAELAEKDHALFATREDLAPEAMIQMAAAVQSFVMGDVGLSLFIPAAIAAQVRGELLLMGWKKGLRSMALVLDGAPLVPSQDKPLHTLIKRKTASRATQREAAQGQRKAATAQRAPKGKASPRALALKTRAGKPGLKEKRG